MLTAGTKLYDTDLFMWFDASQQATGSDATFRTHDLKALGNTSQTAICSSFVSIINNKSGDCFISLMPFNDFNNFSC